MKENAWVVIAAYNEEAHIKSVVSEVQEFCKNIIVVDDGSKDKTYELAKSAGALVLKHIINMGKGAAVKTGCDFALKKGAEILVLVDGDGQHEPKEIPNFLKALEGKDIVFGFRGFNRHMPFVRKIGNITISKATRLLYGINILDTQCGYRAFTSKAYKKVRWDSNDYAMESEMIANAGKHKLKYSEIKIRTIYNDKFKGVTVIDGIKIMLNMILWRLKG